MVINFHSYIIPITSMASKADYSATLSGTSLEQRFVSEEGLFTVALLWSQTTW